MPVSWQMGPVSSLAISTLDKIMSSAWEDCVPGVSLRAAIDIAARTSGGRFVDVSVMSSSRLVARNSMACLPSSTLRFSNRMNLTDQTATFVPPELFVAFGGDHQLSQIHDLNSTASRAGHTTLAGFRRTR